MKLILEAVVTGILTGGVYALMASGLTLVYGVMEIVNIAQGIFVVVGAYLSYTLQQRLHLDLFVGLLVTVPLMFALGMLIEWAFLRRLKARLGTPAALTATAHKLARIVYLALKHGLPYVRKSQEEYEAQMKEKQIKALKRKARQLGLELIEKPSAGSGTAEAPVQG